MTERRPVLRFLVTDSPGKPTMLTLRGPRGGIRTRFDLAADECVVLAMQLFEAARERLDRPAGGPLPNSMHERYAQLRAGGCSQLQAYVQTGRCPDQSSASKWERRRPLVRARIVELQQAQSLLASRAKAGPD